MNPCKPQSAKRSAPASAISKEGYFFNRSEDRWKLNKDVSIHLNFPTPVHEGTESGFRQALQRFAEERSPRYVENIYHNFTYYIKDTSATQVTVVDLTNWRAMLGTHRECCLGAIRSFLIAWHEYGFKGVSAEVVELLQGWRIKSNKTGEAIARGCPKKGAYTDLEMAALLDWANIAVAKKKLPFEDYALMIAFAMTARRPVQITAMRGKDLVQQTDEGATLFRLNIPRAKQRGVKFRGVFRSLAVIEDLFLILNQQHKRSVAAVEAAIGGPLDSGLREEVPIFLNYEVLKGVDQATQVRDHLLGARPDRLHAPTYLTSSAFQRIAKLCTARSERTGKCIRISPMRFRRTRGTKLRREGFGPFVIAELLDHSDIQNVRVYTENTAQEAVVIDQLIGAQLAPFAQACMGKLVGSEREAIRGDDPRSRVPNEGQHTVGTCGSYNFCASGFRACYTCYHFQPWVDGPHEEVLAGLYAEKERTRTAGCARVVVDANDQLILAVEHCVLLCKEAKSLAPPIQQIEGGVSGKNH